MLFARVMATYTGLQFFVDTVCKQHTFTYIYTQFFSKTDAVEMLFMVIMRGYSCWD